MNNTYTDLGAVIWEDRSKLSLKLKSQKEIQRAKELRGLSCREVIAELLDKFTPLDFRNLAGLDGDAKLTRKVYVVYAVEEIINKATSNNWGMCVKNGFTYIYNGRFWQSLDNDSLKLFLSNAALKMGVPGLEAKYHQFKDELCKQFFASANMPLRKRPRG